MTNALILPLIVMTPLAVGMSLLAVRRLRVSDAVGEAIGVVAAAVMVLLGLLAGWAIRSAAPPERADAVIAPSMVFAPDWLVLRLPAVVATNPDGWQLSLGLDAIGLSMVMLTSIVAFAVLLVANRTVQHDRSRFAAWTLLASSGLMLAFTSMDLILFYVGFELTLIPLFALISGWGDPDAGSAAKRFVLYTLAGSIPMVLGLLGIAHLYATESGWSVSLPELSMRAATEATDPAGLGGQTWVFALLVVGLGIKMAMLPLHTWLPRTYGACHATAAAFLAAVVLKLGLFGFVRLALPMVPLACDKYGPTVMASLGAAAIVAGAMMALVQSDLRRLLAYSSLSHVGFVTMGLFALNEEGISGGLLQMFNHGITTAAVFLTASCVIARRGTAQLGSGGCGLASRYPRLSAFMIFFLVAGAGLPGLNNFAGELLTLAAILDRQPVVAAFAVLGVVLGAWYSFRLIQNLLLGAGDSRRRNEELGPAAGTDIGGREKWAFGILAAICLWVGVYPQSAIHVVQRDAQAISRTSAAAGNIRLAHHSAEQPR